jgi:hypothetical protein
MTTKHVGSLVLCFAFTAIQAHANLITNGGFETPVVPIGSFTNFLTGSTAMSGWTVTGPEVSIVSTTDTEFGVSFPAEQGSQWLDLTGDGSNVFEGVRQTVATTAGTGYTLSFWVGNYSGHVGHGPTSNVGLQINGSNAGSFENSTPSNILAWRQFTYNFTATGASTSIEFDNLDPLSDNSNGLDNVDLTVTSTPEPASLGLMAAVVAVLAVFIKRSRN